MNMTTAIILIGLGWFLGQICPLFAASVYGYTWLIMGATGVVLVIVGAYIAIKVSGRDLRDLEERLRKMND